MYLCINGLWVIQMHSKVNQWSSWSNPDVSRIRVASFTKLLFYHSSLFYSIVPCSCCFPSTHFLHLGNSCRERSIFLLDDCFGLGTYNSSQLWFPIATNYSRQLIHSWIFSLFHLLFNLKLDKGLPLTKWTSSIVKFLLRGLWTLWEIAFERVLTR